MIKFIDNIKYEWLYQILGTITVGIFWNYSYFFERKHYLNRILLLEWLQKNDVSIYYEAYDNFVLYNFKLNEEYHIIYWCESESYSVHNSMGECIICEFTSWGRDRKNYNKIKQILERKIVEYEKQRREHQICGDNNLKTNIQ